MIYISLYEYLYDSFETLNEYQMQFIDKIKYIIIHYLYESPIEVINVSSLANELTNLNILIEKFDINEPSKKIEYLTTFNNELESGGKTLNKTRRKLRTKKNNRKKLETKRNNRRKLGTKKR